MNAIIPKSPISIRPAVAGDLAFIDALQKKHSKNVGWMQTMALEKKIEKGEIIVAESAGEQIGYCIGTDRYFKHDDIGIIYQMNVVPGKQRGLVGASLLKAQFERSAWGCKLYCCWCAQDIEANRFWEAMGFVPLAFRAGSEKKSRVHIFWQRRIRSGDVTTPYWFPSQTTGGSIREDRIVLPIPPGVHWSEVKALILPQEIAPTPTDCAHGRPALPRGGRSTRGGGMKKGPLAPTSRYVQFGRPSLEPEVVPVAVAEVKNEKPKKVKRKNDPRLVSAAREFRDRWMERVNDEGIALPSGKYDVSRAIAASVMDAPEPVKLLAA